jgi:hypothetical protein
VITVKVGSDEVRLDQVTDGWIAQAVGRRRADGVPACVQVQINEPSAVVLLSTPCCGHRGGGSRPPNRKELQILEWWEHLRLDRDDCDPANLGVFLQRLKGLF